MLSCWPGPLAWRSTRSVASPDPTLRPDFLRGHGGMVIGAACLGAISWAAGGIEAVAAFGRPQWGAALYLATVCGPGIYYLWSFALGTPLGSVRPVRPLLEGAVHPCARQPRIVWQPRRDTRPWACVAPELAASLPFHVAQRKEKIDVLVRDRRS